MVAQAVYFGYRKFPRISTQATAQTDVATEIVASIESIETYVACVVEQF